jgi:hypothetical protein
MRGLFGGHVVTTIESIELGIQQCAHPIFHVIKAERAVLFDTLAKLDAIRNGVEMLPARTCW